MRTFCTCLAMLLALTHACQSWASVERVCEQDDAGRQVCVGKVDRVVSLAPHATEILAYLGAVNRVVGVDSSSDYPPDVNHLPKLGDYLRVDLERLALLRPDLVIAWKSGITPDQLKTLDSLGIAVFVSEPLTLQAVASNMKRLGRLLGMSATSSTLADQWLASFDALKKAHRSVKPLRVFYQVWPEPLMTLGGTHVVSQIIQMCGGVNIFGELKTLAPTVGVESVVQARPDVILSSGDSADLLSLKAKWATWTAIPAVANGHVAVVPQDILVRNGPRLLNAARRVCTILDESRPGPKGNSNE